MRISAALPHGVSALFAGSARRRRALETALVDRLEEAGFDEVVLPIVDYLEPYEPLLTPASRRELYQFVDRDGELLALRADFTPMLARLVAPRLGALDLPVSVFYRGDVVRFQEERPGRLREFYQLGAELLGVPGAEGEERMLRLFLDLLERAASGAAGATGSAPSGPGGIDVVLGVAGALDPLVDRAAEASDLDRAELAAGIARRDRDLLRRVRDAAARDALLAVAETGAPADLSLLGDAARPLDALLTLRDRLAAEAGRVRLTVDLAELAAQSGVAPGADVEVEGEDAVWGRSYYDGMVFRAYLGAGALPVGGGGRYDRLFRALGAEVPAVGFSLGLDRLSRSGERRRSGRTEDVGLRQTGVTP